MIVDRLYVLVFACHLAGSCDFPVVIAPVHFLSLGSSRRCIGGVHISCSLHGWQDFFLCLLFDSYI